MNEKRHAAPATFAKPVQKVSASPIKHPAMVNLGSPDEDVTSKEGNTRDEAEIAAISKIGTSSTSSLHNTFDILNDDRELPLEEARQAVLVANHIPNGEFIEKPEMFDNGITTNVDLTQMVQSKLNVDWEKELQTDTLITKLTTLAQCSNPGVLIGPSAASVSASLAKCSSFDYHFFTGEYISRSSMTENTEFQALINAPKHNTLSLQHHVSLSSPDPCCLIANSMHSDSTQVADNQAINIHSDRVDHYFAPSIDNTPISNAPCSKAGKLLPTHVNTKSANNSDMPSATLEQAVVVVITVYDEILGSDKGKISAPSTVTSSCCYNCL
ncbi:hypothetical protein MtrunA17_Chr6g0475801 [Medicago truncatula]|uniref:Uncharacterized protein n=1 Tax=Medicago truncatula TaxID=3880 RepID=A0A396HHE3_MEDTR|nr:hypothetical protein MtrunA17_Chr6g0475801 [Medicago truncatula]